MKAFNLLKSPFKRALKVLPLVALPLYLAGCVPTEQQEALDKDVNYLLAVNKSLAQRVATIEKQAKGVDRDIQNSRRGLASIETELKSSLAESNAELDRFREEFGFIRGTVEETDFVRDRVNDEIEELREAQASINVQIASLKSTTIKAEKATEISTDEMKVLILKLTETVKGLERDFATLDTAITDLEDKVASIETAAATQAQAIADAPKAEDPVKLFEKGFDEAAAKDYVSAIDTLKSFTKSYPYHEKAADAQFWLGQSYYARADWERAIIEFNRLIKKYPGSDKRAGATLKQGLAFAKLGAVAEAEVILNRVLKNFPDSPEAARAKEEYRLLQAGKAVKTPEPEAGTDAAIDSTGATPETGTGTDTVPEPAPEPTISTEPTEAAPLVPAAGEAETPAPETPAVEDLVIETRPEAAAPALEEEVIERVPATVEPLEPAGLAPAPTVEPAETAPATPETTLEPTEPEVASPATSPATETTAETIIEESAPDDESVTAPQAIDSTVPLVKEEIETTPFLTPAITAPTTPTPAPAHPIEPPSTGETGETEETGDNGPALENL